MATSTSSADAKDTKPPRAGTPAPALAAASPHHGSLARRAAPLTLAAFAAAAVALLLAGVNAALCGIAAAVGYTAVIYGWARAVEGRRKAFNRFVTAVVCSAFALAMLPLLSV